MAGRLHFRIEGTLGSAAQETWSIGVNYGIPAGGGQGDQATVQALTQSMADWFEVLTNGDAALAEMSENVALRSISAYGYNFAGPASASGSTDISPPRSEAGSIRLPFQSARVVSLITGLPGPRYRGRIYVPALGANVASTGKSTPPAGYLTAWKQIFKQVETFWAGSAPLVLGVYSESADVVTPVTSLRVGDVVDTQRRRRDNLQELYSTLEY